MIISKQVEYVHQPAAEEYQGLAGYYIPRKECRLAFQGREVLYITGRAVLESSCCGSGEWDYVLVPGFISQWHYRRNQAGIPVSLIEPIQDSKTKSAISRLIQEREGIDWISFW